MPQWNFRFICRNNSALHYETDHAKGRIFDYMAEPYSDANALAVTTRKFQNEWKTGDVQCAVVQGYFGPLLAAKDVPEQVNKQ